MVKILPGFYAPINRFRKNFRAFVRLDDRWADRWYRREFFRSAFKALHFNGISGGYVEFGCHGVMTFRLAWRWSRALRRHPKRMLWAFDSFQGLPKTESEQDTHPAWIPGAMATSLPRFHAVCRRAGMREGRDYRVVPGFYSDTLQCDESGVGERPDDIALAYVDCDLHSSTRDVLEFLKPNLKHGMILAFDDWYCVDTNSISGERAAFLEYLEGEDRFAFQPFMMIGWHGLSFLVEDRNLLPKPYQTRNFTR